MAEKRRKTKKNCADVLPEGTVFTDVSKIQWKVLQPIGQGGFGTIYSVEQPKSKGPALAAKVEPHGNGPLFVEKNFFLRNLKPEMLEEYKAKKKLSFLGLPRFIGGGSHQRDNLCYRFLIMERFDFNIDEKLKSSSVNVELVCRYCSQIIDSLTYIHERGYIHMDIKPENLLLKRGAEDEVYLIDFGIVEKYIDTAEFKPDKKKQHNGTLLYCSRDSHLGVGTRRGDLESLGYNLLKWFNVPLPWEDMKIATAVYEKKVAFMADEKRHLTNKVPKNIAEYFSYVNALKHNEMPDYDYVKSMFTTARSANVAKKSVSRHKRKSGSRARASRENNSSEDSDTNDDCSVFSSNKVVSRTPLMKMANSTGEKPKRKVAVKKKTAT